MLRQYFILLATLSLAFAIASGCDSRDPVGTLPTPPDTSDSTSRVGEGIDSIIVEIPEGVYVRGYNGTGYTSDEYPAREITISTFEIMATEVTNAQFAEFLNLTDDPTIYYDGQMQIRYGGFEYYPISGKELHPVQYVDYEAAIAYAEWRGGRLPTESEWEKAARGTDERIFPWGDEEEFNVADYDRPDDEFTIPVGSYPDGASPYGLYDVAGSLWEWCSDYYYSGWYAVSDDEDPEGPEEPLEGEVRVLRGGSFRYSLIEVRCSNRFWELETTRRADVGFRVAWDVE